jgi:hypothetical protein
VQQSNIQVEPKIERYGFAHHETTGITSAIIINGKEAPILFRSDSDPMALKALHALNWRVLLPNADGKNIFLIGQYFVEPKHTSKCEGCLQVEEYHEFKLVSWYITTPFKATREECENCPYLLDENLKARSSLELTDFDDFDGRNKIELKKFQRKARSQ